MVLVAAETPDFLFQFICPEALLAAGGSVCWNPRKEEATSAESEIVTDASANVRSVMRSGTSMSLNASQTNKLLTWHYMYDVLTIPSWS